MKVPYVSFFRIKIFITFLAAFSLLVDVLPQTASAQLTQELDQLSLNHSIVGYGVSIFNKDSVFYQNGFGFSDREKKVRYTAESAQKIASVSKLVLSVSLMKAQELGMLNIDQDVNDFLPFKLINPNFPKEKITIRHLATHSSGLKQLPKHDFKALYFPTPISKIKSELPFGVKKMVFNRVIKSLNKNQYVELGDFIACIYSPDGKWYSKNNFEKIAPGQKEIYSNNGAAFIALIIENASGVPYNEFAMKYIFSPLHMNYTGFDFEEKVQTSSLYHLGINVPNDYNLLIYPVGGLETNVKDFSHFMRSMAEGFCTGNELLSKSSFDQMISPPSHIKSHHGILWEVYESGSVGHQGDMLGTTTYTYYNTKQNMGYLLFCNTAGTQHIEKETDEIISTLKRYFLQFNPGLPGK